MHAAWIDDRGKDYLCTIGNAHHVPGSLVNLIGVTKFGKQIELPEEEFSEGTNIQTFMNHSIFSWDGS